ncbi:hypothetical protein [Acidithiobacillus ferridurans]|uniref:Uncharacterized protein n=1 Tax=Acidithiobacillus ferridurans TaxID=1232575 RepID=A0A8X8GBU7_ACIFI|nr:hypothetical protein [Acidithiobacillus ferridurans]MBU2717142.1 hypothetical protein [Acidithiobacillus ferridurans]MBU2724829.1 hypothetical protein [Acidithiobacillus ferridurans]MBU2726103.1 hypothetical protein [Acidithiobacillus ferridurans]
MTPPFRQKQVGATGAVFLGNVHQLITRLVHANTLKNSHPTSGAVSMSMIHLLTARGRWKNPCVSALHHNNSCTVLRAGLISNPLQDTDAVAHLKNHLLRHGVMVPQSATMGPQGI